MNFFFRLSYNYENVSTIFKWGYDLSDAVLKGRKGEGGCIKERSFDNAYIQCYEKAALILNCSKKIKMLSGLSRTKYHMQ